MKLTFGGTSRVLCIHCLHSFVPEEIRWINADGSVGTPPRQHLPLLVQRWRRWWDQPGGEDPSKKELADWLDRGYTPRCPDCTLDVPPEYLERDTIVVGLVGVRATSKSHYLASVMHLLDRGDLARFFGVSVVFSSSTAQRYRDVYAPVFGRTHEKVEPTFGITEDEHYEPLAFTLRSPARDTAVNLLLFDASGEQLGSGALQARHNKYLYAADALFLFVTPEMLYDVRQALTDGQITGQQLAAATTMFSDLADGIQTVEGRRRDLDVETVRAFLLLTKADQLRDVPGFESSLLDPIEHGAGSLDELEWRLARESESVEKFIDANGGANLTHMLSSRFSDLSFSAVSATGCDVDPETDCFPSVSPIRVLEPLLMVLKDAGFLVQPARA